MPKPKLNDTANSHTHKSTRKVTLEPKSRDAKAHRQAADLTGLQERAAELCSDLILRGGHEEDVRLLLHAIISHECRRRFPLANKDSLNTGDPLHKQMADQCTPTWYADLARAWPPAQNPENGHGQLLPTTITEMIRANVRDALRMAFEIFINSAEGLDELWLLNQVLTDRETQNSSLGEAFADQLASTHTYVKVPRASKERVERLLPLLADDDRVSNPHSRR